MNSITKHCSKLIMVYCLLPLAWVAISLIGQSLEILRPSIGTAIFPKGWLDYALRSLISALLGEAIYHVQSL